MTGHCGGDHPQGQPGVCSSGALPGQGQVAPRRCGQRDAWTRRAWSEWAAMLAGAFCWVWKLAKSRHHHHSSLNAQRSTTGLLTADRVTSPRRRGEGENGTGGWSRVLEGFERGWECKGREGEKNTIGQVRNRLWVLLLAKFLLAFQRIAGLRCSAAARTSGEVRWPGPWRSVRSLQPTRDGQMRGWGREAARVGRQVSVLGPLGVKLRQTASGEGGQAGRQDGDS